MSTISHIRAAARYTLAVIASLALAACAVAPERGAIVSSAALPETVAPALAPEPSQLLVPAAAPAMRTATPEYAAHEVAVLFTSDSTGHADVAAQITALLPPETYHVSRVDIGASDGAAAVAALRGHPELVTVAIGLDAVELARARLGERPIVFCQVFNYRELLGDRASIWGVHSVPPPALQLRAWKSVDSSLRRIGLIVSDAQTHWLEDAREAAARIGIEIRHEVSASDRETLYLFKRLAPQVDGFWLLPDNTILSPAVLADLLRYALSHEVGVLVFNETLLDWGALISASSTAANVARTVSDVVARVVNDRTEGLPAMTPLSEVSLQFNAGVARRLGMEIVPESTWVLREPD